MSEPKKSFVIYNSKERLFYSGKTQKQVISDISHAYLFNTHEIAHQAKYERGLFHSDWDVYAVRQTRGRGIIFVNE